MKKICKYCELGFDDNEYIMQTNIPIIGSDLMTDVYIDDELNMRLYISIDSGDGKVFKRKIKYCPMCGRKLNKKDDDNE